MKAITTRYCGPTDRRGSRYIATDSDKNRVIVSSDSALNSEQNHQRAAVALVKKLRWSGALQGGHTKDGMAWTWIDDSYLVTID